MSKESQVIAANGSIHGALAHLRIARELLFDLDYDGKERCYLSEQEGMK